MKLPRFREFSFGQVVEKYLQEEMVLNLRELVTGFANLTFSDNFKSFEVTVTIPANTNNYPIRNELRGEIPSKRLIVRGDQYSGDVVDGTTAWTKDFVYLRNINTTNPSTVTVVFLK